MNKNIYVGVMSGTSHDSVDVSFIEVMNSIKLKAFHSKKISSSMQIKIQEAMSLGKISLDKYGSLDKEIGEVFGNAINEAINKTKINKSNIRCVAISGQTIWHSPNSKKPFTIQLGDPNIIAAKTKLTIINDFRKMHIALGGKGGPIVPEFHTRLFYKKNQPRVVVNLGGISNYSYVSSKTSIWGSDCGPANSLMDAYCSKKLKIPFDKNGAIASKGQIIQKELKKMLSHQFFKSSFPKSTGKELFNFLFIPKSLLQHSPEDVLATLCDLSAISIIDSIKKNNHKYKEIILCGGGTKNQMLVERINFHAKKECVISNEIGFESKAIESMAFAWFGYKRINNKPLSIQTKSKENAKGLLGNVVKFK